MADLFGDVPAVATAPPPASGGLFDDVPPASQAGDLFGDVPMSPAVQAGPYQDQVLSQGPSLTFGERVAADANAALRNSFLGSAANYLATRLAPDTVPIDPNTGQPINAISPRAQVQQNVQEENAQYANLPGALEEPTLAGKISQGSAAVLGTVLGAGVSPESMVAGPETYGAVRMGWGAAPIIAKAAGIQAGVQAGANTAAQGLNIAAGTQDQFDPAQTAESAGMGAAFGAAPGVAGVAVNKLRGVREPLPQPSAPTAQPETVTTRPEDATPAAPAQQAPLFADVPEARPPEPPTPVQPAPPPEAAPAPPAAVEPPPEPAPQSAPPVPQGMVRLYHGGEADPASGGGRFVTTDPNYAANFRSEAEGTPKPVWYVDVPADHPEVVANTDHEAVAGTNMPAPVNHFEASEGLAGQMQRLPGETTGASEPAKPAEPAPPPASTTPEPAPVAEDHPLFADVSPHAEENPASAAAEPSLAEPTRPDLSEAPAPEARADTVADQAPRPPMGGDRGNPNFSEGTTPYGRVFADAGHDPNTATSLPTRNQVKIIRDQVKKQFGFRDVEINQRSHPKEVRDQLAGFYNGAMEMSHVLGMPNEAIGLQGKLKFTTKPFASNAKVLGSYAPGSREITIPGRSNSFAHEWTHALDHHLSDVLASSPQAKPFLSQSRPLATRGELAGKPVAPGSVGEAFANVLQAVYGKDAATAQEALRLSFEKPTPANKARLAEIQSRFAEGARGAGSQAGYFANPVEMLARSHEAYVGEMIRNQPGGDATGVAKPFYDSLQHGDQWDQLYPQQAERDAVFHAYTELHDRMRSDAILGAGQSPRPGTLGMVDPGNWHKLAATADVAPGFLNKLKREINELKNPVATIRERAGLDESAASPGHLKLTTRIKNSANATFASVRGYARGIAEQQPTETAREAFTQIVDRLTPAEHVRTEAAASQRFIGETWEQAVRSTAARNIQKFSDILQGHGLAKMTPAQELALRHVLTEGTRDGFVPPGARAATPIPDNIAAAAGQTRHLLSTIHDAMVKSGIDVGFAESGYMPRIYDELKITADTSHAIQGGRPDASQFVQDATKLHKIMFDQEVGHDPALLLDVHDRLASDQRAALPQDVQNKIATLRQNLKAQDKAAEGSPEFARLQAEANVLFGELHDPVQAGVASEAAKEWAKRITLGTPTDFDSAGPNASLTRARKLPPEADEIMRDWMVNKPTEALPRYMQQSARRIADAQTFGPKREILEGLLKQAVAGGARKEDINTMREIVEKITGRNQSGLPSGTTRALNVIHAMGTMALMNKAAFSSLTEPLAFYARTGNAKAAAGILFRQIGDVFNTAHSKEVRAMAEALGIVMSSLHDSVLQDRSNAHYGDAPGLNKLLTNYYKSVGLTQLTNSQLRHTSYAAHQAFTAWSKDLLGANKRLAHEAAAQFREFGIPDKYHQDFAKWLTSRDGLPTIPELDTPGGRLWSQAVTRLTEQSIQVPHRVDRPLLSSNPVGRLMFGLMSFNYAFYHHIIELPMAEHTMRAGEAYSGARAAGSGKIMSALATAPSLARSAGHISAAAAAIYLGALATTAVRECIFNAKKWQEEADGGTLSDWLQGLAMSRTGVNGPLDPLVNAFTGLKYDRDLTALTDGAQVGFMLHNASQLLSPLSGAGSAHTNTARYNATVGAYNMFAVPAATMALTVLPGGPFARAAYGATMMGATSHGAADTVATKFAGPKGMKNDGTLPPRKTPPKKNEPKQGSGQGLLGGIPLGMADDVAGPGARAASSVISKLPGALKVPAIIGAGAAGAGYLHSIYTRREKVP